MKLTIKAGEFAKELALVCGAIEKRVTIPILSNVLLTTSGETLSLQTTDLEVAALAHVDATIQQDGRWTFDAKRLTDVVRALPAEADVSLAVTPTGFLSLECQKAKYRIPGLAAESFPEIPRAEDPSEITVKGSALAHSFQRTLVSISTEETRFTLNGALAFAKDSTLTCVSTDGHRMTLQKCECGEGEIKRVLIPRRAMALAAKLFDSDQLVTVRLNKDKTHMEFECGGRTLFTRLLTGNFPDYERVMPKDMPNWGQISGVELAKCVKRLMPFAEERSHSMRFHLSDEGIKITAAQSELGEGEEHLTAEMKTDGGTTTVGFNGQYVLDICAGMAAFNWQWKDSNSSAKFTSLDGNSLVVLMPMRV